MRLPGFQLARPSAIEAAALPRPSGAPTKWAFLIFAHYGL